VEVALAAGEAMFKILNTVNSSCYSHNTIWQEACRQIRHVASPFESCEMFGPGCVVRFVQPSAAARNSQENWKSRRNTFAGWQCRGRNCPFNCTGEFRRDLYGERCFVQTIRHGCNAERHVSGTDGLKSVSPLSLNCYIRSRYDSSIFNRDRSAQSKGGFGIKEERPFQTTTGQKRTERKMLSSFILRSFCVETVILMGRLLSVGFFQLKRFGSLGSRIRPDRDRKLKIDRAERSFFENICQKIAVGVVPYYG
jgi:hypothetical protein